MLKNKDVSHCAISTIAVSALFIASLMLSGSQFSQRALAIHEGGSTTATVQSQTIGGNATRTGSTSQNQTTAADATASTQNQTATAGNATETGATPTQTQTQAAAAQEPPMNQNFVRQGTVASSPGQLAGPEEQNLAFILP